MKYSGVLLWLQFAYAVWQFVRVAKFFRLPSALIYHTWLWMIKRVQFKNVKPFSTQMVLLIDQGGKWLYPGRSVEDYLRARDIQLNAGHFLQQRHNVKYVVSRDDIANCNVIDQHAVYADQGCTLFFCSHVDLILPKFYIADIYDWAEGFDKFLEEGATCQDFKGKVLLMRSGEHFLNQNFMRLLSILPLMLQAKGLDFFSLYASIGIIVLDQLSYPVNLIWRKFGDLMVDLGKLLISRIRDIKWRQFVSRFMASMSPRLVFSDKLLRNFYFVEKNETILLFGTSCAEFLDTRSLQSLEEPGLNQLNPFVELSEEDYHKLDDTFMRNRNMTVSGGDFDIHIGSQYVEHRIGEGRIMTFFRQHRSLYHNFLDFDCLHSGNFDTDNQELNIRKALKWIERNGRLPVTCNHKGQLHAVSFHDFVDKVGTGLYGSVLSARVRKASWV